MSNSCSAQTSSTTNSVVSKALQVYVSSHCTMQIERYTMITLGRRVFIGIKTYTNDLHERRMFAKVNGWIPFPPLKMTAVDVHQYLIGDYVFLLVYSMINTY